MADRNDVVPLRLTAAVATQRINSLMRKPGVISLTVEARRKLLEIGLSHPQLVTFLAKGKVREAPQRANAFPDAWLCCVEGIVNAAFRGAQVRLVLQSTSIVVEWVEWT